MARSESLKKAQKKYAAKHKSSMNRNTYKSAGKNFILNYATKEDLKEYERFILQRMKKLEGRQPFFIAFILRYIVKKYCILYKTCMLKVKTIFCGFD